jgi:hypothetical protein
MQNPQNDPDSGMAEYLDTLTRLRDKDASSVWIALGEAFAKPIAVGNKKDFLEGADRRIGLLIDALPFILRSDSFSRQVPLPTRILLQNGQMSVQPTLNPAFNKSAFPINHADLRGLPAIERLIERAIQGEHGIEIHLNGIASLAFCELASKAALQEAPPGHYDVISICVPSLKRQKPDLAKIDAPPRIQPSYLRLVKP